MRIASRLLSTDIPAWRRWAYNASHFPKLGLMSNDTIRTDNEITKEAIRRLPKDVAIARHHRLMIAFQLDSKQKILPKEQWMQPEEEQQYLMEYIEQVKNERKERFDYETAVYNFRSRKS